MTRTWSILASIAIGLAAGCQSPAPPEPAAQRIENAALGIAVAAVPEGLEVAVNDGERLELVPAGDAATGRIEVSCGAPSLGGVNLVAAVQEHEAEIRAREGGEYRGQRELAGPLGTAFYSRGVYPGAAGPTEETVLFAIHPDGDRVLRLTYRYPAAADSGERVGQLLALLAELEPLAPAAESAPAND